MHAVVINATITDRDALPTALDELVPEVSGAPGFVAGYWIALGQDQGIAILMFDSEASASLQALATQVAGATLRRSTASKSAKSPRMHRTAIARPSRSAVLTHGA